MKKILLLFTISLMFFSCSSYNDIMKADSNIKKVKLDMSKEQVVKIMGNSYLSINAAKTSEGYTETLGYNTAQVNGGIYMFYFLDDKLVEWRMEWPMTPTYPPPYPNSIPE